MKKKKIGICSILGRIHHPGNGSADPDPQQNDPKHCQKCSKKTNKYSLFHIKGVFGVTIVFYF